MSDGGLDGLLGSKISLISQADVRYEGTLFSINASESSIVLKDGEWTCFLLEDANLRFFAHDRTIIGVEAAACPHVPNFEYLSFPTSFLINKHCVVQCSG